MIFFFFWGGNWTFLLLFKTNSRLGVWPRAPQLPLVTATPLLYTTSRILAFTESDYCKCVLQHYEYGTDRLYSPYLFPPAWYLQSDQTSAYNYYRKRTRERMTWNSFSRLIVIIADKWDMNLNMTRMQNRRYNWNGKNSVYLDNTSIYCSIVTTAGNLYVCIFIVQSLACYWVHSSCERDTFAATG